MNQTIENNSEKFQLEKLYQARELSKNLVRQAAKCFQVGMSEDQGHQIIDDLMKSYGSEKKWHPTKFRVGKNTTKAFREVSEEGITLQANDLFFVDIGPVFDGHEGDYGETFVVGENTEFEKIKNASEQIFNHCKEVVLSERLTGVELYRYATKYTENLGYQLNLKMAGHRLGDFPHAIHYREQLGSTDLSPTENKWILEILIRHPEKDFGAFYEDLI